MSFCKILFLCLLVGHAALGQNIALQGRLLDARTSMPVAQATIEIFSLQDTNTYRTTTGIDGTFRIFRIRSLGRYALLAQRPGYANYVKLVEIRSSSEQLGNLVMVDSARVLQEAIVKAKREAFSTKGDTIEYNASYYKTHPDMDAVYLLNKMPGIDVIKGQANGDSISRILINGIVIFGDRPAKILSLLPAGVIEKVQVFTDTGESNNTGVKEITRTRVINIKTNDQFAGLPKGKVYAGGGSGDIFAAGLNAIRQKKGEQLTVDASADRGGVRTSTYYDPAYQFASNGIPLSGKLSVNYSKPVSAIDQLNMDYYLYKSSNTISRGTLSQFSLDTGRASFIDTRSEIKSSELSTNLNLRWVRTQKNKNRIQLSSYVNIYDRHAEDATVVRSLIQDIPTESSSISDPRNKRLGLGAFLLFSENSHQNANYTARLSYSISFNEQDATVSGYNGNPDTVIVTNFRNSFTGRSNNFGLSFSGKSKLNSKQALNFSLNSDYVIHRWGQTRDLYSDSAKAYIISDALFSSKANYSSWNSYAEVKDVLNLAKGSITLEAGTGLRYFRIREAEGVFSKGYVSVNPFLRLSKRYSTLKELNIAFERTNEMPAYEQINPVINASSNYLYTVGNPDIRPAPRYYVQASYKNRFFSEKSMFNTRAALIYIRNNITSSLLIPAASAFYFDGRLIPIGAQLSYAQNVGDYKYLTYRFNVDAPLIALKTVLKLSTGFEARSTGALINEALATTSSYDYITTATFNSVISTSFDFVLYLAYNYNRANQEREAVITRRDLHRVLLNSLATVQLDKRQSLRLEANLNYTSGLAAAQSTRFFLLDMTYQVKVLPSGKLSLGVTVHDILDSYKSYGFEYRNNAIYSHYSNAVGRYLLFMATCSF